MQKDLRYILFLHLTQEQQEQHVEMNYFIILERHLPLTLIPPYFGDCDFVRHQKLSKQIIVASSSRLNIVELITRRRGDGIFNGNNDVHTYVPIPRRSSPAACLALALKLTSSCPRAPDPHRQIPFSCHKATVVSV